MITFIEETNDFKPLPDGDVQATVFSSTIEREEGRKPNINVQFRVSSEGFVNRRIWEKYYLTAPALWRLKQLAVATDMIGEGFTGAFDENDVPEAIQGKPVTLTLSTDSYNPEKPRNRVDRVAAPSQTAQLPF